MENTIIENKDIERSITKKFKSTIWKRFIHSIDEYKLIQPNDKIAVCISGGKDSMILAKCMQLLKKHWNIDFEIEFICMDPGYKKENRDLIESNAKLMEIPIHFFDTKIFDIVANIKESPCYLCARMRRGYLYEYAKSLGCNKIALGHHFNDAVETILLSMFYGAEYKTMMPKLKSTNHKGMELIRPLYLVREDDIIHWANYNNLKFLQCACKLTEGVKVGELSSKRKEIKDLIATLKQTNPSIDWNIFNSIHKVNLDTVIGYIKNGEKKFFLDEY